MRKNFGSKSWFYPLPVLILGTYNPDGTPDAMNAAWGGLYDADKVVLCLSAGHRTTKNIQARGAFTVSFADAAHVVPADYVGVVSGNAEPDKVKKAGFHPVRSEFVDAPLFEELPVAMECTLLKVNEDGNIIGQIQNVSVDESVLDAGGNLSDFLMNDKCAAGTGRFLQVLSGILNMPLDELGRAASTGNPVAISSMCAVFAETEIVGLLARSTPPKDIAAGGVRAIARRMCALARRIPMQGQCVFTGGLATSPAFAAILSDELGLTVNVPDDPQTVGALGAALIAADWLERNSHTAVASI